MNTPNILNKIIRRKREEVIERCNHISLKKLASQINDSPTRGFAKAIQARMSDGKIAIIAEIKKASPSKGILRQNFHPEQIAKSYAEADACCLSVLTDIDFFQGRDDYLQEARKACTLPVLRKDFIIDEYQVYEAKVLNADCILLIVAVLGDAQLLELSQLAAHLQMDVLIEVHDAHELERALHLNSALIGINNRNLHTFETSLNTTIELLKKIPEGRIIVTESGIHSKADIALMQSHDVHCFLIGEAFMKAENPGEKLVELMAT